MFDGPDPTVQPLWVSSEIWPAFADRLRPHLVKMAAASGGRHWPEDLEACIVAQRMQMWVALEGADILAALLTEMHQYPRLRVLRCIGIVGRRPRKWMHLLTAIEEVARTHLKCDRMEALHQFGHERLLGDDWAPWHMLSEKVL
jgi:hypothetical protein